jgi:hypothetical protein
MKYRFFFLLWFVAQFAIAQTPQGFNYQAVIRDNTGKPKINTNVNLRLSILDGSASGTVLYSETHSTQTNSVGLVNVIVGKGSVLSGNFPTIIWKKSKFLQVSVDNVLMGTSELQSVPFAQYAETTNLNAGNGIAINGNTVTNTGDLSNSNEIQSLSLSGNTLSLSNGGGSVQLPTPSNSNTFQGKVSFFNADKSKESVFYEGGSENISINAGKTFGVLSLNGKTLGEVHVGSTSSENIFRVFGSSYFNRISKFYGGVDFSGEYVAFFDKSPRMYKRLQLYSISSNLANDEGGIEFINDNFRGAYIGMRDNQEFGIYGYGVNDWVMRFNISTGSICAKSTITLCSDERLKQNFSILNHSLSSLCKLKGYHYFWKNEAQKGLQTGFKAQEVQAVFPELVETDSAGMLSVNYIGFVPHLLESVKALSSENQAIKNENEALKTLLESLAQRVNALENEALAKR